MSLDTRRIVHWFGQGIAAIAAVILLVPGAALFCSGALCVVVSFVGGSPPMELLARAATAFGTGAALMLAAWFVAKRFLVPGRSRVPADCPPHDPPSPAA
jgi:hypothetical protein